MLHCDPLPNTLSYLQTSHILNILTKQILVPIFLQNEAKKNTKCFCFLFEVLACTYFVGVEIQLIQVILWLRKRQRDASELKLSGVSGAGEYLAVPQKTDVRHS